MLRSPAAAVAAKPAKPMTLDEWASLDEDVEGELVDGVLEEEEMPTFLHEIVVGWLIERLRAWGRRRRSQVAGSEARIAVGPRRGRKPDVSVYLARRLPRLDDSLVRVAPYIVVEVASPRPRDVKRDRVDKVADYARLGVDYYWILDPLLQSLEVLELGRDRRYTLALAAASGRVRIPGCSGLVLDLDALWGEIAEAASTRSPSRRPR